MVLEEIRNAIQFLQDPVKGFKALQKQSFEDNLKQYVYFLLYMALISATVSIVFFVLRAAYLDIVFSVDVDYWRLINYSFGRAIATMFFIIFTGTFGLGILSVLVRPFFRHMKFTRMLALFFSSLTPVILFSWLGQIALPLLIWSAFLLFVGVKHTKK